MISAKEAQELTKEAYPRREGEAFKRINEYIVKSARLGYDHCKVKVCGVEYKALQDGELLDILEKEGFDVVFEYSSPACTNTYHVSVSWK